MITRIRTTEVKHIYYRIDDCRESKEVERFLHKMYAELEETDNAGHDFRINWYPAFYAVDKITEEIVGIITFSNATAMDYSWIGMSGVKEEYRGKGIYTNLYYFLQQHVKDEGWMGIRSGITQTNVPMIKAAEKSGRKATGIIFDWKNPRL